METVNLCAWGSLLSLACGKVPENGSKCCMWSKSTVCPPPTLNCWPISVHPKLWNWHRHLNKTKYYRSVVYNPNNRHCFFVGEVTRCIIKNNFIPFSLKSIRKIPLNRRGKMGCKGEFTWILKNIDRCSVKSLVVTSGPQVELDDLGNLAKWILRYLDIFTLRREATKNFLPCFWKTVSFRNAVGL